jgi:cell division protein FtsB
MVPDPVVFDPRAIEIAGFLANIATVVGVVVAIIGGYIAYTSWKQQLSGTAQYELARRILKKVYKLREEIEKFRMPQKITPEEIDDMKEEYEHYLNEKGRSSNQFKRERQEHLLNPPEIFNISDFLPSPYDEREELEERWEPVQDAWAEVEVEFVEAQMLLDDDANGALEAIQLYFDNLYDEYHRYGSILWAMDNLPDEERDPELLSSMWDIFRNLFPKRGERSTSLRLDGSIKYLEGQLRKYMLK